MRIGDLINIDAESLGYDAHAVGRIDEFVIFINGGVPGDRLLARITRIAKNYAVAETVDIISPSPFRRQPMCIHFIEGCGGCQWQHIDYECQIYWKKEVIRQALKRIGKLEYVPDIEIYSEIETHYRNRLRVFPVKDSSMLGLRKIGSHEVVPIKKCFISNLGVNTLSFAFRGKIFSKNSKLKELDIRSYGEDQTMVSCTYNANSPSIQDDIDKLFKIPGVTSVFYRIGESGKFNLGYGKPMIKETVNGIEYNISPNCFFQINTEGLKVLVNLVKEFAGGNNEIVLDAHCGVGTFALQVAGNSKTVLGTDISAPAINLARTNAKDNQINNTQFQNGTITQLIKKLKNDNIDLTILDPPRSGCEKSDLQALIQLKPDRIIYVSCNPTTLARDLCELSKSDYKLQRLAMVDMFPMTYHLEVVTLLVKG